MDTAHAYNCACSHAYNPHIQLMHTTVHATMHATHACNSCIQPCIRLLCMHTACIQHMHAMHTYALYPTMRNRNRKLQTSKAPLKSQAQGTSLFTSAEVGSNDTTSTVGSNCFLLISEEIAFYQGNKKEQSIIYSSLQRLVRVIDVSLISCTYVSDLF